jgi:cytochrome c-type biogenesis protein
VFCLGLGIPFIVIATASDALTKQLAWMRKRTKWISRIGAAFLIVIGVMLVLGTWDSWIIEVQAWVSQHVPGWTPPW